MGDLQSGIEVWVLALLSLHPSSVRNNGCAMLAVHIYFIFEDVFAPNLFIQKLNTLFCCFLFCCCCSFNMV